jgi:cell division protein FtsB
MINKTGKNKRGGLFDRLIFPAFLVVFLLGALFFIISANWRIGQKRTELLAKIDFLKSEVNALESKNKELKASDIEIQTGENVEEAARDRLGMKAAGEDVVAISGDKKEEQKKEEAAPVAEKKAWWNPLGWWDFVRGWYSGIM